MTFAGQASPISSTSLVNQELQRDRHYHPNLGGITRGGLANHYPMTILALHGLGASVEEIEAFRRHWPRQRALVERDLRLVDRGEVTEGNWTAFLGQSDRLLEFRRVFETLLAARGLDAVPGALLAMREGLPMGLFHPVIRLAFAVGHGDLGLVADALAYMAIRHFDLFRAPLPPLPDASAFGEATPNGVWRDLVGDERIDRAVTSVRAASIRTCEELCGDPSIHRAALPANFVLSATNLPKRTREICHLALRLYLHLPSLTTLHAVTSAQALAELSARAGQADRPAFVELWRRYWIWLTALFLEKGRPAALPDVDPASRGSQASESSWTDLAAEARTIPEVHLIKMAYSCRWLDEVLGPDPLAKIAVVNMLREAVAHPRAGTGFVPSPL